MVDKLYAHLIQPRTCVIEKQIDHNIFYLVGKARQTPSTSISNTTGSASIFLIGSLKTHKAKLLMRFMSRRIYPAMINDHEIDLIGECEKFSCQSPPG